MEVRNLDLLMWGFYQTNEDICCRWKRLERGFSVPINENLARQLHFFVTNYFGVRVYQRVCIGLNSDWLALC